MGIYSKDDLFTLWLNFRGQHDELRMMQDFALCDQKEAQALIADFETRLECATIDGDHRGKEFRVEYGKPAKPKKATSISRSEIAFRSCPLYWTEQNRPPAGLPEPP